MFNICQLHSFRWLLSPPPTDCAPPPPIHLLAKLFSLRRKMSFYKVESHCCWLDYFFLFCNKSNWSYIRRVLLSFQKSFCINKDKKLWSPPRVQPVTGRPSWLPSKSISRAALVSASISLPLFKFLSNALHLSETPTWNEEHYRLWCVWERLEVSFEVLCNLRRRACCVNKRGTLNKTWWGMWHLPCKCLHYSWSTNFTTAVDMGWQFVILNGLHRLVLRQRGVFRGWGDLIIYLSI